MKKLNALFNPEQYQGWGKTSRYFEGWYFKVIDATQKNAFAVIPGVAMDEAGNRQAFIQVLDGMKRTAVYHKFDYDLFLADAKSFSVSIGNNHFSEKGFTLDLPEMKGQLKFSGNVPWPKPWYSPGIMGPFAFAPFMECYHGIVSMDHSILGTLQLNGEKISFDKGRGYLEKDWGRSFPSAYFWMQSNHFSEAGISIKASVAKIPWVTGDFTGFIAGVWLKNKLYRFTTYNRTSLNRSFADEKTVELEMENQHHLLHINATRDHATSLASPIHGFMDGRIDESMTAVLHVRLLSKKNGEVLLDDEGKNAGLEVAGKISEIIIL